MEHNTHSQPTDEARLETLCELLSDRRRRLTVSALSERESSVALADLARDVASMEAETDPVDVPADAVEDLAVSLHHHHLPKLDDFGAITYDVDRKAVRVDRIDPVSQYVAAAES